MTFFDLDRYNTCPVCHRKRWHDREYKHGEPCAARLAGAVVYAVHEGYGCDTGCCGHAIYVEAADGAQLYRDFDFAHSEESINNALGCIAAKLGTRVDRDRCDIRENC